MTVEDGVAVQMEEVEERQFFIPEPAVKPNLKEENEENEKEDEENDSPIDEVRLTVPITDTPESQMLTVRTWVIGIIICVCLAFVNQFFWFRSNPVTISALAGQIVALYLGRMMAAWVPDRKVCGVKLNPGPFNLKEHVLITVFANCGSTFGHASAEAMLTVTLVNTRSYFNKHMPFVAAFLLITTTQTMGYGFAGLFRKYLVESPLMWWPSTLVDVSLFRTLHEKEPRKGISRIQFFAVVSIVSFAWYILPDYFAAISSISWICWVWKDSVTAQQIGSGWNGLGLGSVGLDWATVSSYLKSPLATPWFTLVNVYVGFFLAAYVVIPLCYWSNVYNAQNFPIISNRLFLENGLQYPVSEVLAADGLTLDEDKYRLYGPPHLSTPYVVAHWGLIFSYLTATLTHVVLWNGKEIYSRFVGSWKGKTVSSDIHSRLMQRYDDIPSRWFYALFVFNFLLSAFTVEMWKDIFQISWLWLFVALGMTFVFTLPVGVVTATTNQFEGIGPLCDILFGYYAPGRAIGLNTFRGYAAGSVVQAVVFLRDFKLAHYMKIPPRNMFLIQIVGTILAGFVNLVCAYWLYDQESTLCTDTGNWTCPHTTNGYSAAVIWSLIGTERMFGAAGQYSHVRWMFLMGAMAPVPFWALSKLSPKLRFLKWLHLPVLLSAVKKWPPAKAVNFNSWFLVGFVFNYVIFKYNRPWWKRYNYVLSAALDTGIALAGPLLFLLLPSGLRHGDRFVDYCPLAVCPTAKGINVTSVYPSCPIF